MCELFRKHSAAVKRICFLCAEASPACCHRRLLAEYIASHCDTAMEVVHL